MLRKRIFALLLCLVICLPTFVACGGERDENDKGAYITMYLTDEIYNFDPVYAYTNEEAESIVSLLFARLFSLSSKGKLQYELAKDWDYKEDEKNEEYSMIITLRETWWSDKTKVTADDVVFAWKRILSSENSFSCAALLFDIKNARAVKAGNCSIDDLGLVALNDHLAKA
jgi:oligopeptide transport system substrate-binding protein